MSTKTNNQKKRLLPEFRLIEDCLYCDDVSLDLKRRPLTRRLITAFLKRPDQFLSRQELVQVVYSNFDLTTKSGRFNDALKQNITKMISRIRVLGEQTFNGQGEPWIEMFVYIPDEEGWCLFRLKNQYLKTREQELTPALSPLCETADDKLPAADRAA